MNPLEVINNADTMIKQMGITIKDAFTGDEDATQNALTKWCNSALSIYHKSTGGIIIVNQSEELIPLTCINLSKDKGRKQKKNSHRKLRTKTRLS